MDITFNTKILFLVKTPPPITGATIINQQIIRSNIINNTFNTQNIRLSYAKNASDIGKFNILKPILIIGYWFKLLFALIIFNPKYVYFQLSPFNAGFYRDLLYIVLIKLFGKKLIIHLHGKGINKKALQSKVYRTLYKFAFRNAKVIHLSEKLRYDLTEVFNGSVYYLPNGIKKTNFKSTIKQSEIIQLLFVSNLFRSKGIFVLLESLKLLKQNGHKFECIIVGDEGDISLKTLQIQINNAGLSDQISLIGPKFNKDKYTYFSSADIFIHPTLSDCFPLVLLEAMSMELPIIATDEGAITDIVANNITGFIIEKNNPFVLAEKIEELINSKEKRNQLGKNGYIKFKEKFTVETFEINFINTINQIIADDRT